MIVFPEALPQTSFWNFKRKRVMKLDTKNASSCFVVFQQITAVVFKHCFSIFQIPWEYNSLIANCKFFFIIAGEAWQNSKWKLNLWWKKYLEPRLAVRWGSCGDFDIPDWLAKMLFIRELYVSTILILRLTPKK